jgi:hypothetical protein
LPAKSEAWQETVDGGTESRLHFGGEQEKDHQARQRDRKLKEHENEQVKYIRQIPNSKNDCQQHDNARRKRA